MESPGLYDDWTGNVVQSADVRSLDIGAVRSVRATYRERFPERAEESEEWDDQTFLTRAGVFKRGRATVASLILLGKPGSSALPQSLCIRWRLLDEYGAVTDSRTFAGPMVLASRQAVSAIRNWTCTVGTGENERKVSAYRNSTLMEAVRNAIAHQDYSLGGTIDVIERESESVTVVSRGSFPQRSPESFVTGPAAAPVRNKFLISAMAGLGLMPAAGSGIRSMYTSQAARRFPMPDFDVSDDRVSVRFPGIRAGAYARVLDLRGDLDLRTMMDLDRLAKLRYVPARRIGSLERRGLVEIMDGVPCIASGAGQRVMSAFVVGTEEEAVLALMDRNGSVTRSDVSDLLAARDPKELTPEQVRTKATNLLQSMRRRGLIEKADGSTRSARYVRSDGAPPAEDVGNYRLTEPALPTSIYFERGTTLMFHGTVKGGAILTALMLVAVCLSCMVPAVTEGSAAEAGTSESVIIEIDTGDKSLAEIVVDYATAYAEREYYESMDRDVVIVVPDVPGMPADMAHVLDYMDRMLLGGPGPSAVQTATIGAAQSEPAGAMQAQTVPTGSPAAPSMEPAGAHGSPAEAILGADVNAPAEKVPTEAEPGIPIEEEPEEALIEEIGIEEETEVVQAEEAETEVVQAGSTGIEPDRAFLEDVLEYMESLGDESLDETIEALRAYLNARYVMELNDSLVRTLDDQRDEEPDDSDGPVLVDDDEEPVEQFSEPATEPETPSAPCRAPVYRMGVTTSGLL